MSREKDILVAAINRAQENGYRFITSIGDYDWYYVSSFNPEDGRFAMLVKSPAGREIIYSSMPLLIFEVDFAKALFGEDWEQHLLRLSYESNYLEYLGNFIYGQSVPD